MAAHRYWRTLITSCVYGAYPSVAGLEMATTPGGPNVLTGGTPIESGEYDTPYTAAMAFDGNPSTYWMQNAFPVWVGYDLGAGHALDITEVRITARNDGAPTTAPGGWSLDHSDDAVSWTSQTGFTSAAWTAGETQTFTVTAEQPGRWWQVVTHSNLSGTGPAIAEIVMATTPGGANVLTGATATCGGGNTGGNTSAHLAIDGDPSTDYYGGAVGSGYFPQTLTFDLGNGNSANVREVRITAPAGSTDYGSSGWNLTPLTFDLATSGDSYEFTVVASFTAGAWSAGQTQTFEVPGAVIPAQPNHPQAVIMG